MPGFYGDLGYQGECYGVDSNKDSRYYEVDDDEVATVLSREDYGSDDECSWLLREPAAPAVAE